MAEMQYGSGTVSTKGCGPIAIYNAAKSRGKTQDFRKIIFEAEYNKIDLLDALVGTNPLKIKSYFKAHGMSCTNYDSRIKFKNRLKENNGTYMMAYFTNYWCTNAHYIMFKSSKKGKELKVYNLDGYILAAEDKTSIAEIIGDGHFIAGHWIH
jgi:hypothetical protein